MHAHVHVRHIHTNQNRRNGQTVKYFNSKGFKVVKRKKIGDMIHETRADTSNVLKAKQVQCNVCIAHMHTCVCVVPQYATR